MSITVGSLVIIHGVIRGIYKKINMDLKSSYDLVLAHVVRFDAAKLT